MIFCIERPHTETNCAVYFVRTDPNMNQWSALQSGAAGDVIVDIQHCAHIS